MEGFLLHASNRLENLAELLAEVVKTPLDPMKQETILVQSGGMQRWWMPHLESVGIGLP